MDERTTKCWGCRKMVAVSQCVPMRSMWHDGEQDYLCHHCDNPAEAHFGDIQEANQIQREEQNNV